MHRSNLRLRRNQEIYDDQSQDNPGENNMFLLNSDDGSKQIMVEFSYEN